MTSMRVFAFIEGPGFSKRQKPVLELAQHLRSRLFRFSTSVGLPEEELKNPSEKKLVKVAIVGRPNAGKSTLINRILKLNLCGVSKKSHTTRTPFRSAFYNGDTQVVFVDTPGLVTEKETRRFNLPDDFVRWKKTVLDEADVIGVIHEVCEPRDIFKFHLNLSQNIDDLPSKPLFLVFNKIDLVLDKDGLSKAIARFFESRNVDSQTCESDSKLKRIQKFSSIFFTSALRGTGVDEVVNYLLEQAKPGEWLFERGKTFDDPLHLIIIRLVRARLLNILPAEIPYECTYEVEYLKENELGEIFCVALITCRCNRHLHLILSGKKGNLRTLCKYLESDLYKIIGKVFRIRLVLRSREAR